MIQGASRAEQNYREIQIDSSSSLKDFSMDRKKYYKKYVLNEEVEDKDSQAIKMGKLVETLLMEPHIFDDKFYMSSCMTPPTGLMLSFVEALYKFTKNATNENGVITRTFQELSRDAYDESGFKIKYDAVISKFIGSDAEVYYDEIRKVKSQGLTVVTSEEVNMAEKVVQEMRVNPVTASIVNQVNDLRYTVLTQHQVENYLVDDHPFKSMIDKVIVDHDMKTIQVYDLKCVWAVENFFEEYYLYRRAYIQAYLYLQAMRKFADENEMSDYMVLPMRFIVCDSINYYNPLIYVVPEDKLKDAYFGFEYKGRAYPGIKTLIEDLKWARLNDVWNISRENSINNGIVML